jgi:hypothetical protein
MPYVVDTIEVERHCLPQYLDLVEQLGIPVMSDAGATFVSCASTSPANGEIVDVQIVWEFDDHDQWNVIRKNMVLDQRWYEYADRIASLRTGGSRRFYYPAPFSPS